jgi:hypothetical protein
MSFTIIVISVILYCISMCNMVITLIKGIGVENGNVITLCYVNPAVSCFLLLCNVSPYCYGTVQKEGKKSEIQHWILSFYSY